MDALQNPNMVGVVASKHRVELATGVGNRVADSADVLLRLRMALPLAENSDLTKFDPRSAPAVWAKSTGRKNFFPKALGLPRSRQIAEWGYARSRQRADV